MLLWIRLLPHHPRQPDSMRVKQVFWKLREKWEVILEPWATKREQGCWIYQWGFSEVTELVWEWNCQRVGGVAQKRWSEDMKDTLGWNYEMLEVDLLVWPGTQCHAGAILSFFASLGTGWSSGPAFPPWSLSKSRARHAFNKHFFRTFSMLVIQTFLSLCCCPWWALDLIGKSDHQI